MYCGSVMCSDEALNVVIFTINANIHVFVHVDLHERYLLMLILKLMSQCYRIFNHEKRRIRAVCKYNMQRPSYKRNSGGIQGWIFMKAKGDFLDRVHSDRWFLGYSGGEARPREGGQRQHKGGYQAQVHSDQMVLLMARQGGWTTWVMAKRHSKLSWVWRGTTRLESTQVRRFSW